MYRKKKTNAKKFENSGKKKILQILQQVRIWTGSGLSWVSGSGSTRAMVALSPQKKIQEMSCWGARCFL
jgi:hypothetical protein